MFCRSLFFLFFGVTLGSRLSGFALTLASLFGSFWFGSTTGVVVSGLQGARFKDRGQRMTWIGLNGYIRRNNQIGHGYAVASCNQLFAVKFQKVWQVARQRLYFHSVKLRQ